MRTSPLAITEEARKLIFATRSDFARVTPTPLVGRGGGFGVSHLGRYDFDQVWKQSAYLRLISIVEAFLDTCSGQQFDIRTSGTDAFIRELANDARDTSLRGWRERQAAFKKYHGVTLGTCSGWRDIDAAREVRNSIAHGLGRLTSRQQSRTARQKIESVGVTLRESHLVINHGALDRCARSSVDFILDVDQKITLRK